MKTIRFVRRFNKMLLFLAVDCFALLTPAARADQGIPIQGTFTVTAASSPNTGAKAYCGGTAHSLAVEAHGNGATSFGTLSLSLLKTIDLPGAMHGCLTLTAPNGDVLNAVYDGTEGAPNGNGFVSGTGTFTFTGGTGKFQRATGTARFTGVFLTIYPASSFLGGTSSPVQVAAYYTFEGTLLPGGGD